jgi:hypothetical protein
VINYASNDLDAFAGAAEAVAPLADRYSLRMAVNHLAARDIRHRTDLGDPYLQYSANFPDLFHLVVPAPLAPHVDQRMVEENRRLAQGKLEVLGRLGIGAAFIGREPVYLPEALYQEHPHWRGPRIDHPRRSRNPIFAPCFHQPEVQALYRAAFEALGQELPGLDTFYWWTNDSGSGFCWYDGLYPGPNGPSACREQGPVPAMAAFHAAALDGIRAAGVADPMSIMTQTQTWDDTRLPPGTYHYPSDGSPHKVASIRADVSLTYPVRHLWDAVGRLEQLGPLSAPEPAAIIWWLSDVYHRTTADHASIRAQVRLWDLAAENRAAALRPLGRLSLLRDLAVAEFGEQAADDVLDGWLSLHDAFARQVDSPLPRPFREKYLPTYGAVSQRWLTRPLVAFPGELKDAEEEYYLPHIFALGDEMRRSRLLDLNGYPVVLPGEPYDLLSPLFDQIVSAFTAAGHCFERASQAAAGQSAADLAEMARAARLLGSVWRSCRNWVEFAVLRSNGVECTYEEMAGADTVTRAAAEAYRQRLHGVMRDELDNAVIFQALLGADTAGVVARGVAADDEDAFTLAPDLHAQLTRRRDVMVEHWQDVARLLPLKDRGCGR